MSKVVIVGGGVIGLACAYYLRKKNVEVVIIEKGELGEGCSMGNAGLVTPSLSQPLPTPDLVGTSIKWLMKKDSPLYIKPLAMPSLSSWLYKFWRHCNEKSYQYGNEAGFQLLHNTLQLFDDLEEDGVKFEIHKEGILCLFLNENGLRNMKKELKVAEKYGYHEPVELSAEEVHTMVGENILSDKVFGGLYLPDQRHLRPDTLTKGLAEWLLENGTDIKINTRVTDLNVNGNKITGIKCGDELIEGDNYLIAAGAWTGELTKKVGFKIPLVAGKGYSITTTNPSVSLNIPLHLGDSKVAVIPYNGAIRTVGTMELSGMNENIDQQRIKSLKNAPLNFLNASLEGTKDINWTGMRPMTPDGLPVLGELPGVSNGYLATGHAMNGIYMSLPTGLYLSELICGKGPKIEYSPFSPSRFV